MKFPPMETETEKKTVELISDVNAHASNDSHLLNVIRTLK